MSKSVLQSIFSAVKQTCGQPKARRPRMLTFALVTIALAMSGAARADDTFQWNGFALLRASSGPAERPLQTEKLSAQVQLGIDWRPSPFVGAHLHLLARNPSNDSQRGSIGTPEAYLEGNVPVPSGRVRIMAGAFFLPTSRENVDALWESPYTMTSSALNSWLGEEFRPIGVDVAYTAHHSVTFGATLYRGNDTFGGLPAERGWALRDHWILLGERIAPDPEYFSSVSGETDHRLGYALRGRWHNENALVQLTHIDNRSDAELHGDLLNWLTRFEIASAEYSRAGWTFAAESGWGTTWVAFDNVWYPTKLDASYVLVSRQVSQFRATLRAEEFRTGTLRTNALTAALFWTPRGKLRYGTELTRAAGENRASVELRYSF